MRRRFLLYASIVISITCLIQTPIAFAYAKGIYLTQSTVENSEKVKNFIQQAKAIGINTFVIDVNYKNSRYARNIALIRRNNIHYVARVVVFPDGGTASQIKNPAYWAKRWQQAAYAVSLGAREIQLDYIRYKPSQSPSHQNAKDVYQVIQYFKNQLRGTGVKLQIDVFGVSADRPALYIGQNIPLFANSVDAICPMVYPSHYEPHPNPSQRPYQTVFNSVSNLKKQLQGHPNVKVYAFIESNNYRYPMSVSQKQKYIQAQIKGVMDAGADGWYFWSPSNKYQVLFSTLKLMAENDTSRVEPGAYVQFQNTLLNTKL